MYLSGSLFIIKNRANLWRFQKVDLNLYNRKFKQNYFMSEQEITELIRRKEMLFKFLRYMRRNEDDYTTEDYNNQVDSILDQIIRINYQLNKYN